MNRNEPYGGRQDAGEPVYHQPMSVAMRVFLVVGAAFTFLAPYDLLIRPGIPVFQLGMIPVWIIAGGASLLGILLLLAAVVGFSKTVRFDLAGRRMVLHAEGIFRIARVWSYPFDRLGVPTVRIDSDSDGPPTHRLEIPIDGKRRPFEIASFPTEAGAQAEADRLRVLLKA